jgi:hypothetical protein
MMKRDWIAVAGAITGIIVAIWTISLLAKL